MSSGLHRKTGARKQNVDKEDRPMTDEPCRPLGGIVLCGGQSRRMGQPKAWLPWGEQTMLAHVVGLLQRECDPVVVVAAADQSLPSLPQGVEIVRDEVPDLGPLGGLMVGLQALEPHVPAVYVSSCDVPLLKPAFVRAVAEQLDDMEVAVPVDDRYHYPLAAVYRPRLAQTVRRLVALGTRRPVALFDSVACQRVPVDELRRVDPELESLVNINTHDDYRRALQAAGLQPP